MTDTHSVTVAYTSSGPLFTVHDGFGVEPSEPFPLPDAPPQPFPRSLRQLETLWLDDRVTETGDGFVLSWAELYDLDPSESSALSLPEETVESLELEVHAVGSIKDPSFRLKTKIQHPELGIIPDSAREGAVMLTNAGPRLVPRSALPIFEVVDRPVPDELSQRLKWIGDARRAAKAYGARLGPFLEQQEILVPDAVGVGVDVVSPEEIHLHPVLEGEEMDAFAQFSEHSGPTKSAYTIRDGRKRKRVVLDQSEKQAADQVRSKSVLKGPDVPRFFNNPQAFVPEEIDLTWFSRRVKGLVPRTYTSQPYVRAEARGRDWFSISTEVALAAEASTLGPAAEDTVPGEGEERDGSDPPPVPGSESASEDAPPSISPDEYAELCQEALDSGERYVFHKGSWVEIDPKVAERHLEMWENVEHTDAGEAMLPRSKAAYVLDVFSNLEELEYDERINDPQDTLLDQIPRFDPPGSLQAELMEHQLVGYRWLRFLTERRLGGLLADDMGLGKTVQVISFLAYLSEIGELQPTLIVLPSALVENWKREIRKFCPSIQYVYEHIGTNREKNPQKIGSAEVVLTTYQTLLRDQLIMGQIDWKVVAADEAQYVKNPTAQSTSVLKAMKADFRLALTGTPVENGLSELWCIVDFVQPGRLGSQKEFRDTFEKPIRDAADGAARLEVANSLQRQLTPHYIRRLKEDVLDELPARHERIEEIPMGSRQQEYYGKVIQALREKDVLAIAALQRLLQICSHPELFAPSGAPVNQLIKECPKLQRTVELIEEIAARGEKVLLFTRLKRMQQILQDVLEERFNTHALIVNGEVHGSHRVSAVQRFNEREGFGAMVLGPEAAGVGMNITGANHIIHYTRLWNPAKENQATDRAYRIGQTKPVTIYYPVVVGEGFTSVEQRLAELLHDKQELARNVVWPRSDLDVQGEMHEWIVNQPAA